VQVLSLDAADPASIAALARQLRDRPIDVMIANAGVMGPTKLDPEGWTQTLVTNSIGPTLLAAALKANVTASSERKMVAITSQMGSIADNGSGGYIAYRSSKAALNAAWKSLSIDWRDSGIALAMLHPGWVQTDMGGPNAAIDVRTSVDGMRRVIAGLTAERSGAFLTFDGRELPW
jgi:NAD(P)-dependent dehydrogenase (short-subunit alcohol dehydrogenase family)